MKANSATNKNMVSANGQNTIGFSPLRCMKNSTTSVAFVTAIASARVIAGAGGMWRNETPTVLAVSRSSAPKTAT